MLIIWCVFQNYDIFYSSAGSANIQENYSVSQVMGVLYFHNRICWLHRAAGLLLREAEAQQHKVSHKQLGDRDCCS